MAVIAASYGTVSDFEVVWTLIALLGLGLSLYNVRGALVDRRWIRNARVRNGREMIAATQLRLESARAACQVLFIAVGVLAMLLRDPPSVHATLYVAAGAAFRWALLLAACLVSYQSWCNFHLRKALADYYRLEHPDE